MTYWMSCCGNAALWEHLREGIPGQGLAFMHSRQRLHQALGPTSVLLNRVDEQNAESMTARRTPLLAWSQ